MLLVLKHPRPTQFNSNDYKAYKSLVTQTKVKSFPNRAGTARPHTTWKWKHMLRKMVIPEERIVEVESEDNDDTDTASIGGIGEVNHLIYHHLVYYHLILVHYHLVLVYHHPPILALMEMLKRRRVKNLFIKVME